MGTKTINQLGVITALATDDKFIVWDTSAAATKAITYTNVTNALSSSLNLGAYLLTSGSRTGATSQAQTFTNGIIGPSWKPASNGTNAIQVQNAAGTAILYVDTTNGRLGVGKSSPSFLLDMQTTDSGTNSYSSNMRLLRTTSGNMSDGFGTGFLFSIEDSTSGIQSVAGIGAVRDGADNTGMLQFRAANAGANNTRMVVRGNGNIGAGTEAPISRLHIVGDDAVAARCLIVDSDGETGDIPFAIRINTAPASASDGDTKFIVDHLGYVGIGFTSSPGVPLGVRKNNAAIYIAPSFTGGTDATIYAYNPAGAADIPLSIQASQLTFLSLTGNRFNFFGQFTPTGTADATGSQGDVAFDDSYIYYKSATGWKRAALSTF